MQIKPKKIAVVNYGIGNLQSIINAFKQIGVTVFVTSDTSEIMASDGLIFPGVGAFSTACSELKKLDLWSVIKDYAECQKPVLGICLGMQLLFSNSEENGLHIGLDLIRGSVKKLGLATPQWKLPHIGWNQLDAVESNQEHFNKSIVRHLNQNHQYFIHSFCAECEEPESILATCKYGNKHFVCAVKKNNIMGVQFHPEKSGLLGLQVLKNFVDFMER